MLSVAELGVGGAISYSMYKPVLLKVLSERMRDKVVSS